jgi:hypothetical protein
MNKEIAERWCTALRSGKYRQGTGTLRQVTEGQVTFCCLGVLTDLYLREHNQTWDGGVSGNECHMSDDEFMPHAVEVWAGTHSECGSRPQNDGAEPPLTALNDGTPKIPRLTFGEIADIIEKEAETL